MILSSITELAKHCAAVTDFIWHGINCDSSSFLVSHDHRCSYCVNLTPVVQQVVMRASGFGKRGDTSKREVLSYCTGGRATPVNKEGVQH